MGFFKSGTKFAENPKKKIKALQKAIAEAIEIIAKHEKDCLEEAARELEEAIKFEGRYKSIHMERKEKAEKEANYHATLRQILQKELGPVERLKQKHIEALQDEDFTSTAQKTRRFCFFFKLTISVSF